MIKSVLITGANSGLGKETARQMALLDGTEKIYLGCRNEEKAKAAKISLEASTGKSIFEILLIDVSNLDSVRSAVKTLARPIDALVMNAGGMGGKQFADKTVDGVIQIFASNVLGHVVLVEELLNANKLTKVALYVGSEGARGVPAMMMKRPALKTSSIDEFVSICDGSFFGDKIDASAAYAHLKYMAALWMSALARKYSDVRIVTVSPGNTSGTAAMDEMPAIMRFMMKYVGYKIMPLFGLAHKLEIGAKRFVDGLNDDSYKSGVFYASEKSVLTGPLVDQATIFSDLSNVEYQDNASEAIHRFIN